MDGSEAQGCAECARLREVVQRLTAQVQELQNRLDQNSSNSHQPPSSNAPWQPPTPKKPTGRKRGGQKGHRGHHRKLLPPGQVDCYEHYIPSHCKHCGDDLPRQAGAADPKPHRHQVAELPPITAVLTEHQGHARTCRTCGKITRAPIPPSVLAHVTGPRLSAVLSYLAGRCHDGRRTVVEVVADLFGVPLSLGTVARREAEMSEALVPAQAQALAHVREAKHKNVDETGWKQAGKTCWLWVAAAAKAAAFALQKRRSRKAFNQLMGKAGGSGIISSDRAGAYARVPLGRRQLCWAHLNREFRYWSEFSRQTRLLGEDGLEICRRVFSLWRDFRERKCNRRQLQRRLSPLRQRLHQVLKWGLRCGHDPAAHFCRGWLKVQQALWTFTHKRGVEPTNNHAERMLRPAVLWRKNSFGCQSPDGCRFVERMLTTVQSLRLQGRRVLAFLCKTLQAHREHRPAPALI
jgi:transposase